MIGEVTENLWRLIAIDTDGIVTADDEKRIGEVRIERSAYFAYRAEAEDWRDAQIAEGFQTVFGGDGLGSAAVSYYGPTDAPGNCWSVSMEKISIEAT